MKKFKICLSVGAMDESFAHMRSELSKTAEVVTVELDGFSLKGVDIFIGKKLSAEKLAEADCLKAVFAYKTGIDDFPLAELEKRGIILVNSHINSRYIAEYAFGLGIALVNRIAEFDRSMRQGDWCGYNPYWNSIFLMKVGLVGYGNIGREINKILTANGIKTYTLDRGKEYKDIVAVSSLEELCSVCDMLILSLPKTAATDKMFDKRVFGLLKGKFIVNVGRSNCIDENALYCALKEGGLAGAAIDTWREKPASADEKLLPFDMPFITLENIILSSHKAMQVRDGHAKYVQDTLESVLKYINGETPANITNLSAGY